jgi:methylated-DNA-[protein]-cysteine S-methyltransferase
MPPTQRHHLSVPGPLGLLTVRECDGRIVALDWGGHPRQSPTDLLHRAALWLEAYFAGSAAPFDLPAAPAGTPFQHRVWDAMCRIPHGRTTTYGDLAGPAGGSARAVGVACGANPIPILIPCHRVVARSGFGGYSGKGGLETKLALLRLERAIL